MDPHETEFHKHLTEAAARFSAARGVPLLVTGTSISLGAARFNLELTRDPEQTQMLLRITEDQGPHEKTLAIETLPAYFQSSCAARAHRCIATVDGWVRYIPRFRDWWRSAAEAHNRGRIAKVSGLRERRVQLGTYDLDVFDFSYAEEKDRFFTQVSYNPDRSYICMTLNDTLRPSFWWNFLIETGAADDISAHNAMAECFEVLDGLMEAK